MSGSSTQLRLVHSADHALNENNLARAAIWWLAPLQTPIWEAMELTGFTATVSGIPESLGSLTVFDAQVMVVLQTWLGRMPAAERVSGRITYSLNGIWRELGHGTVPNAEERERLRCALERLTYATIKRSWYDKEQDETVEQVRRLIADADFIKKGRPGQWGRKMRGFVALAPELLRQLERRQFAYALDLPTLLELRSPQAQRLYLFLAGDQMQEMKGAPGLRTYSYPLGAKLYGTLGITDGKASRVRLRLMAAAQAICEREPLYRKIAMERMRRGGWKLVVVREEGRSKAPARRAQRAAASGPLAARLTASIAHTGPQAEPVLRSGSDELARLLRAGQDPRVQEAWRRWLAAVAAGSRYAVAWEEYRRDLRDWVAGGEAGFSPVQPEENG